MRYIAKLGTLEARGTTLGDLLRKVNEGDSVSFLNHTPDFGSNLLV